MVDPCIRRQIEKGIALTCHVDALLVIGKKPAVEEILEELERTLELRYAKAGSTTNQAYFKNTSKNEHRISVRSRGTITTGVGVRTWRMRKWGKVQDNDNALNREGQRPYWKTIVG